MIWHSLFQAAVRGEAAALVAVASVKGSAPREAGTAMVVTPTGQSESIGGGRLEFRATRIARKMLAGEALPARLVAFPLGPDLGQCCGGFVRVYVRRVAAADVAWLAPLCGWLEAGEKAVLVTDPEDDQARVLAVSLSSSAGASGRPDAIAGARRLLLGSTPAENGLLYLMVALPEWTVFLYGAGHVGRALATVLATLPCRLRWIDERADAFPSPLPPGVVARAGADPVAEAVAAPPGSDHLVITHSHARDFQIVEAVLRRGDFAYLGLIGSATKRARFVQRLLARGLPRPLIDRLVCPIGDPGIAGKEPGTIAVAVAAQLLRRRRGEALFLERSA